MGSKSFPLGIKEPFKIPKVETPNRNPGLLSISSGSSRAGGSLLTEEKTCSRTCTP
jgi:hypothetical protein